MTVVFPLSLGLDGKGVCEATHLSKWMHRRCSKPMGSGRVFTFKRRNWKCFKNLGWKSKHTIIYNLISLEAFLSGKDFVHDLYLNSSHMFGINFEWKTNISLIIGNSNPSLCWTLLHEWQQPHMVLWKNGSRRTPQGVRQVNQGATFPFIPTDETNNTHW